MNLSQSKNLVNKSNEITNRFGQLAIAKINLEKQSESVEGEEFKLHEELEALRRGQGTLTRFTQESTKHQSNTLEYRRPNQSS